MFFGNHGDAPVQTIEGIVIRAGTTKDPSMSASKLTVLLDSDLNNTFTMQSWAYPLEVSSTQRGDRITITYVVNGDGTTKVKSLVNHSYRQDVGKNGDCIIFD